MSAARRTTLGRLLLLTIGGVAVGAVVLTALITVGLSRFGAADRATRELEREAERLAAVAEDLPCEGPAAQRLARTFGGRARFVPDDAPAGRARPPRERGRTRIAGTDTLFAARPATICGRAGTLLVFRPAADAPVLPEGMGARLLVAAAAGLAAAAAIAVVLARRMAGPLGALAGSARSIARGERSPVQRSVVGDPAEIADLKDAFAEMVDDLRDARDREEQFLLSVSHELRTPLTAIKGYGEALADGTSADPVRAGEVVTRESDRLERLVGDLLDLARLRAGEFSVRAEDVDLGELAHAVAEGMAPAAAAAGVRLEVEHGDARTVATDPHRAHQMLANLVENALRVGPEGSRVRLVVDGGTVAVEDEGPGLEAGDLEHAFERFYLWRKYRGVRSVGSGLGLAVVAELARLLDVRAGVETAPGRGTRFVLAFPSSVAS